MELTSDPRVKDVFDKYPKSLKNKIPKTELKHCISLALKYHKVKKLPLLGT